MQTGRARSTRSCATFTLVEGTPANIEHDAPYVNVLAEPASGIITVVWKNYAPSGTYRSTLNTTVDLIIAHKLRYFLTDQRRRGAILHADELWLKDDWAPRMAVIGLARAAIVMSPDFFNRTTIERVAEAVKPSTPYPIKYFKEMEEARTWLLTGE